MRLRPTKNFIDDYNQSPRAFREKTAKALRFLLDDLRHPSLRAKKYDETRGIWQARIDLKYRFYFLIEKDTYILLKIKKHK